MHCVNAKCTSSYHYLLFKPFCYGILLLHSSRQRTYRLMTMMCISSDDESATAGCDSFVMCYLSLLRVSLPVYFYNIDCLPRDGVARSAEH